MTVRRVGLELTSVSYRAEPLPLRKSADKHTILLAIASLNINIHKVAVAVAARGQADLGQHHELGWPEGSLPDQTVIALPGHLHGSPATLPPPSTGAPWIGRPSSAAFTSTMRRLRVMFPGVSFGATGFA